MAELHRDFDPLPQKNKERNDALQRELLRQKQLEQQRLKFFEDMRDLEELLDSGNEYIHNPLESDTEHALSSLADSIRKLFATIKLPEPASPEEQTEYADVCPFFYLSFIFLLSSFASFEQ